MTRTRVALVLAAGIAAATVAAPFAQTSPRPAAPALLAQAAAYMVRFNDTFTSVVAEERYVQQASGKSALSGSGRGAIASVVGAQRRELVSDFLLVKLPEIDRWVPLRDVFEVDGKPVREREERLLKLLTSPTDSSLVLAQAIVQESARFNIGEVERTINMPLLALGFLDERQQPRFEFKVEREDGAVRAGAWMVTYREKEKPTVVTTPDGRSLFASGTVWLMPSGEVVRTEIAFLDAGLNARITTTFSLDERFGVEVPRQMDELYTMRRSEVRGHATYGRFRKFGVSSSEVIPLPEVPDVLEVPGAPEVK
ncbi:MAG: hypothetical protein Q7J25_14400 [Vicinamibacterales bacterium]|nr:hypothetical protein [Vicinamibacterales bacterium]